VDTEYGNLRRIKKNFKLIKETTPMIRKMDMEYINGKMAPYIKVSSRMI
jgi:hypothetical protein